MQTLKKMLDAVNILGLQTIFSIENRYILRSGASKQIF